MYIVHQSRHEFIVRGKPQLDPHSSLISISVLPLAGFNYERARRSRRLCTLCSPVERQHNTAAAPAVLTITSPRIHLSQSHTIRPKQAQRAALCYRSNLALLCSVHRQCGRLLYHCFYDTIPRHSPLCLSYNNCKIKLHAAKSTVTTLHSSTFTTSCSPSVWSVGAALCVYIWSIVAVNTIVYGLLSCSFVCARVQYLPDCASGGVFLCSVECRSWRTLSVSPCASRDSCVDIDVIFVTLVASEPLRSLNLSALTSLTSWLRHPRRDNDSCVPRGLVASEIDART